MRGRLRDMTFTADGRQIVSLVIEGDFREQFDKLKDADLDIEVKKHRERRSKNANDYLWVLCEKIAKEQGTNIGLSIRPIATNAPDRIAIGSE